MNQIGERVERMGRERSGKTTMIKGGRKQKTNRGMEFSRQGLPKIYGPAQGKISEEIRSCFLTKKN
jgi:hypothetical protein